MEPEKIPWRLLFRCYKDTPCSHPFSMSTPGCETNFSETDLYTPENGGKNNKKTAAIFRQQLGDDIFFENPTPMVLKHIYVFFCWTWQKISQFLSFLSGGRGKRLHHRYGQSCRQFMTFSCSTIPNEAQRCSIKRGHKHVVISRGVGTQGAQKTSWSTLQNVGGNPSKHHPKEKKLESDSSMHLILRHNPDMI